METSNRRRQFLLWTLAISISTALTLATSELIFRLAARMFPRVEAVLFGQAPSTLPDVELEIRGNPRFPEHDVNGFRNKGVPDTTDIVAIGDSHTYGTSVAFNEAWPRVLEKLSSCRVYSMALGNYGPLQYAILAKRALQLKPRLILVGIYFGNDFYDNWKMYLRTPNKYLVPNEMLTEALKREQRKPLADDIEEFFYMGQRHAASEPSWSPRFFLARNSALWGFARAIKNKLISPQNAALTPEQLGYASVFEGPDWKTILTSRYREAVENADDPRIRVGIWLTKWAIQHIDQMAKQNSIETIFILLPTKESVFVDKVKGAADHKYFQKLTTEEEQLRQDLIEYMKKNSFGYIDMAPSLRSMAQQPYFEDADGHPNAAGQKTIATRLQKRVGTCKH